MKPGWHLRGVWLHTGRTTVVPISSGLCTTGLCTDLPCAFPKRRSPMCGWPGYSSSGREDTLGSTGKAPPGHSSSLNSPVRSGSLSPQHDRGVRRLRSRLLRRRRRRPSRSRKGGLRLLRSRGPRRSRELRDILLRLDISCGKMHRPSAQVDARYRRFYLSRESHRRFEQLVGSWHPRKGPILRAMVGARLGPDLPGFSSAGMHLDSPKAR